MPSAAPLSSARLSVAPMMERTDRHARYFYRLLSRETLLYTEMVTTGALLHGDAARHLAYNPEEHPVALQLGGSDPDALRLAARMGADAGYDEINLNVGCPSDRVQGGNFGACLMRDPDLVRRCLVAMVETVNIPVTIKCRLGVDDQDTEETLDAFVRTVMADTGTAQIILHARKAWLSGLSPKQNRDVPPLDHARVHRIARDFPHLSVVINGGVTTLAEAQAHLEAGVAGVMLGRAIWDTPSLLCAADREIFGHSTADTDPKAALHAYLPYVERERARGTPFSLLIRAILPLFRGAYGARAFRRHLTEAIPRPDAGADQIVAAMDHLAT